MKITPFAVVICAGILVILSAGCQARLEDAKDTRTAGPVTEVDAGISGSGDQGERGLGLRVLPLKDWQQPDIPVILPARAISIWVFPIESRDGLSVREGFWIHRVYENFSWGLTRTMTDQSISLNQATNLSGTPLSIAIPEDAGVIDPEPGFENALHNFNRQVSPQVPWLLQQPGGQQGPQKQLAPPPQYLPRGVIPNPSSH